MIKKANLSIRFKLFVWAETMIYVIEFHNVSSKNVFRLKSFHSKLPSLPLRVQALARVCRSAANFLTNRAWASCEPYDYRAV